MQVLENREGRRTGAIKNGNADAGERSANSQGGGWWQLYGFSATGGCINGSRTSSGADRTRRVRRAVSQFSAHERKISKRKNVLNGEMFHENIYLRLRMPTTI